MVRIGIRCMLDGHYEVCGEAGDGREAIRKANEMRPDLILLDVNMPVLNGIDAARAIRQLLPDIKILMLSLHSEQELLPKAKLAGADGALSKTSPPAELLEAIGELLGAETGVAYR
jgi:two-component system, NarL family, response regulator NreC